MSEGARPRSPEPDGLPLDGAEGWTVIGTGLPHRAVRIDRRAGRRPPGAANHALPGVDITRVAPEAGIVPDDRLLVWRLDDVRLTQSSLGAVHIRRSSARIAADGYRSFDFVLVVRGAWSGCTEDGVELTAGPGEIVCLDLAKSFTVTGTATECITLSIARPAVLSAATLDVNLHGHVFHGVGAALLVDHCLSLSRHVGRMHVSEVAAVRGALLAQVAAAISLVALPAEVRPSVLRTQHAARRYIDLHLGDPELGADRVRGAVDVSRSALYRAFADQGGIDAYIQRRRLQTVHALLRLPDEVRSIGELAYAFGFSRPSQMTTAFRRAFGYTPRRLRAARDGGAQAAANATTAGQQAGPGDEG